MACPVLPASLPSQLQGSSATSRNSECLQLRAFCGQRLCINYKFGLVRATGLEIQVPSPEVQRKAWLEQELVARVGAATEGISAMAFTLRVVRGSAREPHTPEPHQCEQGCGVELRSGLALERWAVHPMENKSEGLKAPLSGVVPVGLETHRAWTWMGFCGVRFWVTHPWISPGTSPSFPALGFSHMKSSAPVPGAGCWGL